MSDTPYSNMTIWALEQERDKIVAELKTRYLVRGDAPRPEELPLMTEYRRRAQEVSAAAERSLFMEREFVLKKVLNKDANEALADHHAKRAAFGAWLLEHHWSLLAPYMNSGSIK